MKHWTLAAALPLLAASAVALPLKSSNAQPSPATAAAQQAAGADPRQKALDEITAWRAYLPHTLLPSRLTTEFEPRLDEIERKFKDAPDPADAKSLAEPQKAFEQWQHDFVVATCRDIPAGCASTKQLYAFSAAQRSTVADFQRQRAAMMDPKLHSAQNAVGSGAQVFYDNNTGQSIVILPPGSVGLAPTAAEVINARPRTPSLAAVSPPPAPGAKKPFSLSDMTGWLDYSGIKATVIRAVEGAGDLLKGFAGWCYYGAKTLMIKAGMLPPEVKTAEEIGNIGIGSRRAYMFNAALKHNATLQARLHVRPLKLSDITDTQVKLIPEKTVFVFDRSCAGFDDDSGHIELKFDDDKLPLLPASAFYRAGRRGPKYRPTIAPNEVMACSDGCMLHTAAYLRHYGKSGCLNAYAPVLDRPAPPPLTNAPGL